MVYTTHDKWHPCDERSVVRCVTGTGVVVTGMRSHFATCPNARQHRKKARS